jgi:hypothetical protein
MLKAASLDLVEENDPAKEALILLSYKEVKGQGYSSFGLPGPTSGHGTNIEMDLSMLSPGSDVLLRVETRCGTPFSVPAGKGLHEAALDSLKASAAYRYAGPWVKAGIGSVDSLRLLLPLLADKDHRTSVLGLVERLAFQPGTDEERAWLALGRDDYATLRTLGSPAVDPLLAFLKKVLIPIDSAKAAAALADIGDPRATKAVVERALEIAKRPMSREEVASAVSILDSAGEYSGMDPA